MPGTGPGSYYKGKPGTIPEIHRMPPNSIGEGRLPGEQQLYAQELSLQAENKEREAHTLSTVSS